MRIVFIGAVEFSLRALEHLALLNANIVGVCTSKNEQINSDYVDLSDFSAAHKIPCYFSDDINSFECKEWIKNKQPDVIFCFGWSRLISNELLQLTSLGVIGFHPAALPLNRGRHPIIWALVLGLKKTAATFFFMDEGADSGDILSQKEISILNEDDARSLYNRITQVALEQITDFLPLLIAGRYQRIRQDCSLSNSWRKRNYSDGLIDWRMSAQSIYNLVRGLSPPYPGAHLLLKGVIVRVLRVKVINIDPVNVEPGKVLEKLDDSIIVKCGENSIALLYTEPNIEVNIGDYL